MDSKPSAENKTGESAAEQSIQISIPPEIQRGVFANQALIANTAEEFILDFILATPPAATMTARVLITPGHAKRLAAALQENVRNYETAFGEIKPIQVADESNEKLAAAGKRVEKTVN